MMVPLLLIALPILTARADDVTTAASWIWYPESVATEGADQTRYLRKVVQVEGAVAEARLRVMADDGYTFRVNGEALPAPLESGLAGALYDLSSVLKPGENVLAFSVYNAVGKGGLIVTGSVREAGGRQLPLRSDTAFRASREAPDGWDRPGFDDSAWPAASIIGSAFAAPWYHHPAFDMEPFFEPGDKERWAAWREALVALPPGLDKEPYAQARIGYVNGSAALTINRSPRPALIYRGTVDPFTDHGRRQIALFRDAGVHVYAADVPFADFWQESGPSTLAAVDDRIRAYLSADPEAYLILLATLVPPRSWMDAHPDELVRYAQGDDYNSSDEAGRVARPSLASKVWRHEALAMWTRAIKHLEAQPWGKRVIAYHPCFGIYGEWHYYGSWTQQMPDTAPAMTAHFREWLRKRYGTVERLREAWGDPQASFEAATVPGVEARLEAGPLGLRDPLVGRRVRDYYECQQEITADDIELFCSAAKEATGGRVITGVFYGYFNGVPPQTQGGHLELERLLKSPSIDYFAAPYDYSHRPAGQDGRLRSICDAFPLAGKVHMIEEDTRTHLHPIEEYGRLQNADESVAVIRRQVATALTHGCALWWCDFGADGSGGWYDDPRLIGEVAQMVKLAETRQKEGHHTNSADVSRNWYGVPLLRRNAEVALVCDLKSCYWLGDGEAMRTHYSLVDAVTTELYHTGTPFDTILLSQLPQADLGRYRLVIFLNTLRIDPEQSKVVAEAIKGRAALWLWAPGITDGEQFGPDLVRDLTGFRVALRGNGLPAGAAICESDHPLTHRIPTTTHATLEPRETSPVSGFLEAANWYNPRDEKTMQEQYSRFDWQATGDTFRWDFATTASWTDIHLKAEIPECDGLSLEIAGEGVAAETSLRLVVKGDRGGEFVAPSCAVGATPRTVVLPFAGFTKASWDRSDATAITFPLTGLKLVLDGASGGRQGSLLVRNLCMVSGDTKEQQVRTYGDPGASSPVLTVDDPTATVLARDTASGEPVLACRGKGRGLRVLSTLPFVPRELLSALMEEAGVRRYTDDPNVIVRADSGLTALHTATGTILRGN